MNDNGLILELWARIKLHIPVKERLEVADMVVAVFDEYGQADESLLDEELDKELKAAVSSRFGDNLDDTFNDEYNDEY